MRLRTPVALLTVEADLLPLLRDVVARGGHLPLIARGDSMRPSLHDGDVLVLGPLKGGKVHVGDIVLWSAKRRAVIHRVVALRDNGLLTRGDARQRADGWVRLDAVIGRVVQVKRRRSIRKVGRLLLGLREWWR